jgi:hypothetical protein
MVVLMNQVGLVWVSKVSELGTTSRSHSDER